MNDKKPTPLDEVKRKIAEAAKAAQVIQGRVLAAPVKTGPPADIDAVVRPMKPKKPRPDRSPKGRDRAAAAKGRLPDGATISATYLAGRMVWVCRLAVLWNGVDVADFHHQGSGLFQTLSELDDKYRAWLADQPPATLPVTP